SRAVSHANLVDARGDGHGSSPVVGPRTAHDPVLPSHSRTSLIAGSTAETGASETTRWRVSSYAAVLVGGASGPNAGNWAGVRHVHARPSGDHDQSSPRCPGIRVPHIPQINPCAGSGVRMFSRPDASSRGHVEVSRATGASRVHVALAPFHSHASPSSHA